MSQHPAFTTSTRYAPYWWDDAPRETAEPPSLPGSADVVIIGSGFSGLSCALALARAGRGVVVLDAGEPGFGASTRNGGQVGSGNQKFRVAQLIEAFGAENALKLLSDGVAMLDHIAALVEREGIDCHFTRCGRFRGCAHPAHYEVMARDMEALQRFAGVESFMVPRAEQASEVGTDRYHGGGVLPADASLHPGLYHAGLLSRVREAGASVVGMTRVKGLERERQQVRVSTSRGDLHAGEVVVASNGYTSRATPDFHDRIVSPASAIIATEPLSPEMMDKLLPRRRMMGETSHVFHYYRASPDGRRLLFGGRSNYLASASKPSAYRHLYKAMVKLFPALDGIGISHAWSGRIGYTVDQFPHIGGKDRIWFALGYCGTGVSRSTWFGHKLALKMLGDPDGATAFDNLEFAAFPKPYIARRVVPLAEALYRLRDRLRL